MKKTYHNPKLTVFGSVAGLTNANNPNISSNDTYYNTADASPTFPFPNGTTLKGSQDICQVDPGEPCPTL